MISLTQQRIASIFCDHCELRYFRCELVLLDCVILLELLCCCFQTPERILNNTIVIHIKVKEVDERFCQYEVINQLLSLLEKCQNLQKYAIILETYLLPILMLDESRKTNCKLLYLKRGDIFETLVINHGLIFEELEKQIRQYDNMWKFKSWY